MHLQAMQRVGKQVRGFLHTHNDGGWADAKRAEERVSDVWGLWPGNGRGIT